MEDRKEISGSLGPRNNMKCELKPMESMKRQTSVKKMEVSCRAFSRTWDYYTREAVQNCRHMMMSSDSRCLHTEMQQEGAKGLGGLHWLAVSAEGSVLPCETVIGWMRGIIEMGQLNSEFREATAYIYWALTEIIHCTTKKLLLAGCNRLAWMGTLPAQIVYK